MQKRMIPLFLVLLLCLSCLCARQAQPAAEEKSDDSLRIVATIFPPYDFARRITGEYAEVTMLLKPGAEGHAYEPTPQDIRTIQSCDLFLYTGGENDVWIDDILSSMGDDRPDTLRLMDCVPVLAEEVVEGMEAEEGEEPGEPDEHVWTSPKNAMEIVKRITALVCAKDPDHADAYQETQQDYLQELAALDADFRDLIDHGVRRTVLFGDRFPFRYFAEEYGLDYYAAFTGCSTETEASAATIAFLIDRVQAEQLPVVFTMEFSNGLIADSICEATGAQKLTLHSCHTVSRDDLAAGATYLTLMRDNLQNLHTALY